MKIQHSSTQSVEQILVEAGLIHISQVELALQEQTYNGLEIDEILVLHGWIKPETIDFFRHRWSKLVQETEKKPLLYYFQEAGLLDTEQINAVIKLQNMKQKKIRFHHLAVQQGYLKQMTVDFFLANLFKIYNPNSISVTKPFEMLKSYAKGERNFPSINLSKAPLMNVSLKGVILDNSDLRKADFTKANLSNSSFIQANLNWANFVKANLTEVNFTRSFLKSTNFREAHLEKANFQATILHKADLRSAYLAQVNFAGADLTNTQLPYDFPYDIFYDENTRFDWDFNPQSMGWKKID
ncbi:MAG: hypothetical protein Tsb0014_23780 [Pleurocapsa sp.]